MLETDAKFFADSSPLYYPDGASNFAAELVNGRFASERGAFENGPEHKNNPFRTDGKIVEVADPVCRGSLTFSENCPASRVVVTILDDPWIRRLQEVHQSSSLGYLYPSARNTRFAHVLGVASLGIQSIRLLWDRADSKTRDVIMEWSEGFALALIAHDIAHFSPGSHGAYRVLFPGHEDVHEELACDILRADTSLAQRLYGVYGSKRASNMIEQACSIISEDRSSAPQFLIQLLSGGGWNADRGDWVARDAFSMTGSEGVYCNRTIQRALLVTSAGGLAIEESAIPVLETFALLRSRLYWSAFSNPLCLAFEHLSSAVVQCAREQENFLDELTPFMRRILTKNSPFDLSLADVFELREHQWLVQRDLWCASTHFELRFLAQSLRDKRGPCALPIPEGVSASEYARIASELVEALGFNPKYHVGVVTRDDGMGGEEKNALDVLSHLGDVRNLSRSSRYLASWRSHSHTSPCSWLVLPGDIVLDFQKATARVGVEKFRW